MNQKNCKQTNFNQDGALIDDHRIHVDVSQSVSKIADDWQDVTSKKRRRAAGGFGGIDNLDKKRQYRSDAGRRIAPNSLVGDREMSMNDTKGSAEEKSRDE